MSGSIAPARVVSATKARVIGTHENVCISIFRGASVIGDIHLVRQTIEQLIRAKGRIGYLNILGDMTSMPSAQMRQASKELMQYIRPNIVEIVFIAEGDTFWQDIVRTMMRGMTMFSDPKPTILSSVKEGADRLAVTMNAAGFNTINAAALARNIEQLRGQMDTASYMHA